MDIVFVEDDAPLARAIAQGLREDGHGVRHAATGAAARRAWVETPPDILLLDLGLPDCDGLEVLRDFRTAHGETPVLITTARGDVESRVVGLESGADDYLVKPYAFPELLARVRAIARRARPPIYERRVADLTIGIRDRSVERAGERLLLTPREFDLLLVLAEAEGQPVARDTLARVVWHVRSRATSMDNVIDVQVSRLREKIDRGHAQALIHTVRGVGFALRGGASA